MTTQELVDYYANLLIMQYVGKPKAYATMQALASMVMVDKVAFDIQNAFELESASGVHLDAIGVYIGVTRVVETFTSTVSLSDTDYRSLLKMALIKNNSGSSLYEIQRLISIYFPTQLRVFDFSNMRLGYFFSSSSGAQDLAEAFLTQGLLPKPMGVEISSMIYVENIENMFGFTSYDPGVASPISGMNDYTTYYMDRHWLSYGDTISI